MPSLTDAFRKVQRADELFQELVALRKAWCAEAIKTMQVVRRNACVERPSELEILARAEVAVVGVPPVPQRAPAIVGDYVNNLRSALDYLIAQLAELDSGVPQEQTQFPITEKAADFRGQRPRRLVGVSDAHASIIESLQPYNGCAWTRQLQALNNADKHRNLVILAGGSNVSGIEPRLGQPVVEINLRFDPTWVVELDGEVLSILVSLATIGKGVAGTLRTFDSEFPKGA